MNFNTAIATPDPDFGANLCIAQKVAPATLHPDAHRNQLVKNYHAALPVLQCPPMDTWPMWIKVIAATLILGAFWGLMLAPSFWPWLAPVPLVILGVATVRSFMASLRK